MSRLDGARCDRCIFWAGYDQPDQNGEYEGFCRRYAPRPSPWDGGDSAPMYVWWHVTSESSWCGEFEARDEKGRDEAEDA